MRLIEQKIHIISHTLDISLTSRTLIQNVENHSKIRYYLY